ncbi:hypothetical protein [Phormidium nigroviride]
MQPDLDLRTLTTETGFFTESAGGNEVYSEKTVRTSAEVRFLGP